LRALDELIFAPLRRLLGPVERWLLSPDGALHVVPFAALVDEKGCYLAERTRITYLTSGRDLLRPAARHAPSTRPLIMAAPDYRGRQTPLPGTAAEADALRAHFPEAEVFVGAVATKAVLARARAPLFVHIATHGFVRALRSPELPRAARSWCEAWREGRPLVAFDPVRPPPDGGADPEDALDAAGLVLAGATDAEAMLTAREVAALDLGGTQLAVLSACETGVGDIRAGEGVYGLRRALAIAGVEAQVVSLWKVHDAATAELMDDYYGRLRRGEGRSEALRQAQLAMLHKPTRAHPYYWAAFVPIGDERPLRFGLEGGEAKGKPWG
jgi:CHAT domain-containing protein